jgi:uncharacterized membrane protein YphA (DoxX/SURF4 family)
MRLRCAHGLAIVRIGLGATFLMSAFEKTRGGWLTSGDALAGFVQKYQDAAVEPFGRFLQAIVVPNAGVFAQLVLLGEWVAGISLTLGLLTRLGAMTGVWLTLNYLLSKGPLTADATDDRIFVLSGCVVAVLAADLAWSIDGVWRRQLMANPVSRWLAGLPATRAGGVPLAVESRPRRRATRAA